MTDTSRQTRFTTDSVERTQECAADLGRLVRPGDVIALSGDLGAGKTHFTQGLAGGLGVNDPVTSPTFTILIPYENGRIPLYHFDLYRLESPEALEDTGFFDFIEGGGVAVIEWADMFPDDMPDDVLDIRITVDEDGARRFAVDASGARSAELLNAWIEQVER